MSRGFIYFPDGYKLFDYFEFFTKFQNKFMQLMKFGIEKNIYKIKIS